jgi:hypothetical protein
MDSHGKRLIMFKAKVNRRFSLNAPGLRPVPRGLIEDSDFDVAGLDSMSPMISNSANLMMSAMYTPLDQALGSGQALGPPEAFYPFTSVGADGTITQEEPSSYDEEDLDDEDLWNIGDFLNFGEESSEEGDGEGNDAEGASPSRGTTPSTSARGNKIEASHPLLDHFDRGVVGAFRKNQTRHQLLSRNAASRESLAFSGPYRQGTLRGIKGGRLAAANVPITPLRKQKSVKQAVASSPGSPLGHGGQKRKFSGEQQGHKRTRSIV